MSDQPRPATVELSDFLGLAIDCANDREITARSFRVLRSYPGRNAEFFLELLNPEGVLFSVQVTQAGRLEDQS